MVSKFIMAQTCIVLKVHHKMLYYENKYIMGGQWMGFDE